MIWRCVGGIFKVLLKFKMAATDQLKFFWGAKTQKIIFERCYQNSEWPPEVNYNFFCGRNLNV